MRKKSHLCLAGYISHVSADQEVYQHRLAFAIGNIMPDCKPSFITKRHEYYGTIDYVARMIEKLTAEKDAIKKFSTMYFERLGEVIHYIADYFTFPHNREYPGTMKDHCVYEGILKDELKAHIRGIRANEADMLTERFKYYESNQLTCTADILEYLKAKHREYVSKEEHTIRLDIAYIMQVCTTIAFAVVRICQEALSGLDRSVLVG